MAGNWPPARSGGATMSGQPSPSMSATVPELRHEPEVGSPSDDSSKRTTTSFSFGVVSKNSERMLLKYSICFSVKREGGLAFCIAVISSGVMSCIHTHTYLSFCW